MLMNIIGNILHSPIKKWGTLFKRGTDLNGGNLYKLYFSVV
jgi:predicted metallopeptidase